MSFSELRRRVTDAAFARFGDDAILAAVDDDGLSREEQPVRVRFKTRDEEDRYGGMAIVDRSIIIRIRSWEVATPPVGAIVEVTTGRHAGEYTLKAGAMQDEKGVWHCPALPADA